MTTKIHHVLLFAITSGFVGACGDDGPCLEGGNDGECVSGETGADDGGNLGCAPAEGFESGTAMTCQGEGTGWLVTEVYGAGDANPITSCLAYAAENLADIPNNPTSADCAPLSLDLIPYDIPSPAACCQAQALPADIVDTCMLDCGYASCLIAIEAIRASADALEAPQPILEDAYKVSKADLHAYADLLEAPMSLQYCANKILANPEQVVSIGLGSGASNATLFGHIKDATLYVGCSLDPDDPYVLDDTVGECSEPTNIPTTMAEQESEGTIHTGAIMVTGPGVNTVASLENTRVSTREILNRDMSVDFTLTAFDAMIPATTAGSFEFHDAQIRLAGPASGTREGQTVSFAPGTLRFSVTAEVRVDGEPLFDGLPLTAEYGNDATATAIRGLDGTFYFVDATVETGEYTAVLNTQPSVLRRVQSPTRRLPDQP